MSVKITSPVNLSQFNRDDAVSFQGNADGTIVRVELFAEQYKLSSIAVVNNSWSTFYPFNRVGKRRIIAKGFDSADRQIMSDAIDLFIVDPKVSVLGIDVSNHNPPINWQAVRSANISFAFAKATEGATWRDITFATNWSGMKTAGVIRGAYHFFRPKTKVQEQIDNYLDVVKNVLEPGDLPPVLDLEAWPPSLGEQWKEIDLSVRIERVTTWLEKVEKATGEKPIIYTAPYFWKDFMGNTQEFTQHPLWLAHFTDEPQPQVPANNWGGNGYTIWQYTESGRVSGVNGNVDKNRFKGSFDKLVALANNLSG